LQRRVHLLAGEFAGECGVRADAHSESHADTVAEPKPDAVTDSEPDSDSESVTDPHSDAESVSEPVTDPHPSSPPLHEHLVHGLRGDQRRRIVLGRLRRQQ
jgi:hypothetical protein